MKGIKTTHNNQRPRANKQRGTSAPAAFPFSGIVGQGEMKLGLILNVIDPTIGGVLLMGHRGTGKSTAVRALADLLPEISITRGCSFNCEPGQTSDSCPDCKRKQVTGIDRRPVPVVDLPLGATEDRVCGSIDIQRALTEGIKAFEPGLLARANRGFLYIDEVNLLEDHLVDLLLDVAITGRNKVERESISFEHPARFVLVGSGNPEEGELRPQLLDRFGLYVEVKTENEIERRIEIVESRELFERDAEKFAAVCEPEQKKLRQKIARARRSFATVKLDKILLRQIATLCSELQVDGHRGELTIMRAARALAALAGRKKVAAEDVRRVATMALRHRLHRDALSEASVSAKIEQALERALSEPRTKPPGRSDDSGGDPNHSGKGKVLDDPRAGGKKRSDPQGLNGADAVEHSPVWAAGDSPLPEIFRERHPLQKSKIRRGRSGLSAYNAQHGHYVRAGLRKRGGARIALDATLRALLAAGCTHSLGRRGAEALSERLLQLPATALRFKEFARKQVTLFIFAIDTSGSMAHRRISEARGALLELLRQSYIDRDEIAIVAFRGVGAETLLPVSRSTLRAKHVLDSLSVGGGTPLSAGLASSIAVAQGAANRRAGETVLLLFTDGGANVPLTMTADAAPVSRESRQRLIAAEASQLGSRLRSLRVQTTVVEGANGFSINNDVHKLAAQLGARHLRLSNWQQATLRSTSL